MVGAKLDCDRVFMWKELITGVDKLHVELTVQGSDTTM